MFDKDPTLPQHDKNPEKRARDLSRVSALYAIDPDKLPPLALCEGIPGPETASARWLAMNGLAAGKVLVNVLENKHAHHAASGSDEPVSPESLLHEAASAVSTAESAVGSEGKALLADIESEAGRFHDFISHLENHEALAEPEDDGDEDEDAPAAPPDPAALEDALNESLDGASIFHPGEQVSELLRAIMLGTGAKGLNIFDDQSKIYLYDSGGPSGRPERFSDYAALYRAIPAPPSAGQVNEDQWFARRRLTGSNARYLQRITELPDRFPVTEVHHGASVDGDSLAAALAEGRAFLLDYSEMDGVAEPSVAQDGTPKYFYTPMALFTVPPGGGQLRPVAVQCTQTPGADSPIFTPADGWRWAQAKTTVETADAIWFEAVTHLGRCHLLMEAFSMATRRHLAPRHPVNRLLVPHCEGTININELAIDYLVADDGAVDQTFGASIASTRALAGHGLKIMDFRGYSLPRDLASRGLDDRSVIRDYPYRDDALRLHGAIGRWVASYVNHYYRSEADLAGDFELRAWAAELGRPFEQGGVSGFGAIDSRADLIAVLTEAVFTGSAQHAAVNFPQWSDMGFAPSMAGGGWAPAPTTTQGGTEADWIAMLPPLEMAELQGEFLYLLGQIYYTTLGEYRDNDWRRSRWFKDRAVRRGLLKTFQEELEQIERDIQSVNAAPSLRAVPYTHLLPSKIPQSINI